MKRNRIRLTESDLHRIVKKSVNNVIKEAYNPYNDETEQTAEGGFCEYAERYGLSAFGYAIYDMIKKEIWKLTLTWQMLYGCMVIMLRSYNCFI